MLTKNLILWVWAVLVAKLSTVLYKELLRHASAFKYVGQVDFPTQSRALHMMLRPESIREHGPAMPFRAFRYPAAYFGELDNSNLHRRFILQTATHLTLCDIERYKNYETS